MNGWDPPPQSEIPTADMMNRNDSTLLCDDTRQHFTKLTLQMLSEFGYEFCLVVLVSISIAVLKK